MGKYVIGISALYHDSACCILRDGKVIAAAQEERFTRNKHDPSMPVNAFKYCLKEANITIDDISYLAYYEKPLEKLSRQIWSGYNIFDEQLEEQLDSKRPEREIREKLGYQGPIEYVGHHLSHASSSYYFSGYENAAILTIDGVGEWETTTYGIGCGNEIEIFEQVEFPNSIGLLYSTFTSYLGFKVNDGEYKVMGLAPYGEAKYVEQIKVLIKNKEFGQYELNMEYFDFVNGEKMYSDKFISLFGEPARIPETPIEKFYKDVAKSLQVVVEEIVLSKIRYLREITGLDSLCLAGGVALNCVVNGKIIAEKIFKNVFIQPAASDAGTALGAAAYTYLKYGGSKAKIIKLENVFLGPAYSGKNIRKVLDNMGLCYHDYSNKGNELLYDIAKELANGKVIGWFQGRMEFGPRALGARSILGDPRDENMRDRINMMVKKREGFRPFAPSVLKEKAKNHFELVDFSPYMLLTCPINSNLKLPAITHVDNSARIQTVSRLENKKYAMLIEEFEKITNCPLILNTSFNVRGEPIVMAPLDAIMCFINTTIDCLVLEDYVVYREENNFTLLKVLIRGTEQVHSSIDGNRYTFL